MADGEKGKRPLVCSHCGQLVGRLSSSRWTVTLPTGETVHRGDLICEDCQRILASLFTAEDSAVLPPE